MKRHRAAQEDRPAILIACDGVIVEAVSDTQHDRQLVPCAIEGLRVLSRLNLPVILLAREGSPVQALLEPELEPELVAGQVRVLSVSMAAGWEEHASDVEQADLTQQVRQLARQHKVALASSVLICESWASVHAALAFGCQPVLVMTGRGREQLAQPEPAGVCAATWFAADLVAAALAIEASRAKAVHEPVA